MAKKYLLTGASGHLGSVVLKTLLEKGERVRVLVLPGEEKYIPDGVETVTGDVTDVASLPLFFANADEDELILLHCAGIVTIASRASSLVNKVNVTGTDNVMRMAMQNHVKKAVYVSSVHAIVEKETGDTSEPEGFYPEQIQDPYGKSKAMAAQVCLNYAKEGLDVSVVHPSGIIGPGDVRGSNHSVRSVIAMAKGLIPVSIKGGFDFVDVRDVAQGIIDCAEYGRKGECYILSGHYMSVRMLLNEISELCPIKVLPIEVPYGVVKAVAPLGEKIGNLIGKGKPLVTPYSIAVLNGNGHFTHEKATKEWGYQPRDMKETIRDTIEGSKKQRS